MKQLLGAMVCLSLVGVGCNGDHPTPTAPSPPSPLSSRDAIGQGAALAPTGPGTAISHTVTDLAGCLRAATSACFSVVSGALSAAGAINAPLNLTAAITGGTVTLRWTAPAGAVTYTLEAGSAPGRADLANLSTGNAAPTMYTATGVPPGTYYVRVRAFDASFAFSPPSNEVIVVVGGGVPPPCTLPGAPTGLTITTNNGGTIGLGWNAASGATSYLLEAGSAPGVSNLANLNVGAVTTFTASGIGAGTYFVRTRASNGCGTSGPSNEATIVVTATAPPPPRGHLNPTADTDASTPTLHRLVRGTRFNESSVGSVSSAVNSSGLAS